MQGQRVQPPPAPPALLARTHRRPRHRAQAQTSHTSMAAGLAQQASTTPGILGLSAGSGDPDEASLRLRAFVVQLARTAHQDYYVHVEGAWGVNRRCELGLSQCIVLPTRMRACMCKPTPPASCVLQTAPPPSKEMAWQQEQQEQRHQPPQQARSGRWASCLTRWPWPTRASPSCRCCRPRGGTQVRGDANGALLP